MKLVILGSGTSVPHPTRAASAYWLETENSRLLLDAGSDVPHRLAQEHLDWPNVDSIWISHLHWDHFGGLPALLFGMKWAPQTKDRTQTLSIFGGKGFRQTLEAINLANNFKLHDQRFPVDIVEVRPSEPFQITGDLSATALSTPHTAESLAIRLTDSLGKSVVFTSDTGVCEELIPFSKDASVLLMECSFRKNKPLDTHLELAEALRIAAACQPGKLVLTHLYAEWDGTDLAASARERWSGETIEATDGLKVII